MRKEGSGREEWVRRRETQDEARPDGSGVLAEAAPSPSPAPSGTILRLLAL